MRKAIIDIIDFLVGLFVFYGSVLGCTLVLSQFFNVEKKMMFFPALICFGRFIYKIGGSSNESNET